MSPSPLSIPVIHSDSMGADGGSIPHRAELVRSKNKEAIPPQTASDQFGRCAISQEPLEPPVVICGLGNLYNKTSVLSLLLQPQGSRPSQFSHLKSLKDVKEVRDIRLEPLEGARVPACPVSGVLASGGRRFVAISACGCLLAEKCARELEPMQFCPICGTRVLDEALIPLYGSTEETDILRDRLEKRRLKERKTKKRKKEMEPYGKKLHAGTKT